MIMIYAKLIILALATLILGQSEGAKGEEISLYKAIIIVGRDLWKYLMICAQELLVSLENCWQKHLFSLKNLLVKKGLGPPMKQACDP
jgi:hypothetical protein